MKKMILYFLLLIIALANAQESPGDKEVYRLLQKMQKDIQKLQRENKELKNQVKDLQQKKSEEASNEEIFAPREGTEAEGVEDAELEALRNEAKQEAEHLVEQGEGEQQKDFASVVFESGQLALQALNPEISVTGDFLGRYVNAEGEDYAIHNGDYERSRFEVRGVGLHMQSYLDPNNYVKLAISYEDERFNLEEAYMTSVSILPNVNLTFGRFRQQFGIVNRWHKHALDQVNFPLPLVKIFGEEGLDQTGISIDYSLPDLGSASQALTVQITNGENERIFQGEHLSYPVYLVHYKYYQDLSKSTYAELGITGLVGSSNQFGFLENGNNKNDKRWKWSEVLGVDFTLLWEPVQEGKYRNFTWRSEFYFLWKEILRPNSEDETTINAYGAYSYVQAKISRTLEIGVRGDIYLPDHRNFTIDDLVSQKATHIWQVSPYITWMPSPFVKLRLEYDHIGGKNLTDDPRENRVYLQLIFAAGPHKHERY